MASPQKILAFLWRKSHWERVALLETLTIIAIKAAITTIIIIMIMMLVIMIMKSTVVIRIQANHFLVFFYLRD